MRRRQQLCQQKDRMRQKAAKKHGPKKICLTMIVRNESMNMDRLLDSVASIINMISICDTGSTDNTEEVIIAWGKSHNIPTRVHHEPFINFSHNRSLSVRMAQESFSDADYLLLSDADFVWEINTNGIFDRALLIDHKYLIEQHHGSLSYWNIRMLHAKIDWECIGVTHEYWRESKKQPNYGGEIRQSKISQTNLCIRDMEDGGFKTSKFQRDEQLLRAGLADEKEPEDLKTRYKFYLGQTLKDQGKYSESIDLYQQRIADQGWYEEIYYSYLQIGYCWEQLGWRYKHILHLLTKEEKSEADEKYIDQHHTEGLSLTSLLEKQNEAFDAATKSYEQSYIYRKVRLEGLLSLARMYRQLEMYDKTLEVAIRVKNPKMTDDSLFVDRSCYDYAFDFEVSISAFFCPGKKDLGRIATVKLLERDDLPEWMTKLVEQNSRHYL